MTRYVGLDVHKRVAEAVEEWAALTKQFPPLQFLLTGWIAQAKNRLK